MARVVVDVMLKPEILDPQGQAVNRALPRLGFDGVFAYALDDFWRRHAPTASTLSVEAVAYEPGSPGRVFKLERHVERLFSSARAIRLTMPLSPADLTGVPSWRIAPGTGCDRRSCASRPKNSIAGSPPGPFSS